MNHCNHTLELVGVLACWVVGMGLLVGLIWFGISLVELFSNVSELTDCVRILELADAVRRKKKA